PISEFRVLRVVRRELKSEAELVLAGAERERLRPLLVGVRLPLDEDRSDVVLAHHLHRALAQNPRRAEPSVVQQHPDELAVVLHEIGISRTAGRSTRAEIRGRTCPCRRRAGTASSAPCWRPAAARRRSVRCCSRPSSSPSARSESSPSRAVRRSAASGRTCRSPARDRNFAYCGSFDAS